MSDVVDVLVIGAGYGGMAAALELASGGARVVVSESLSYPGGCAATFHKQGHDFEAGATLFSGFDRGQLFDHWRTRFGLDVEVSLLERPLELRTAGWTLPVWRDRAAFQRGLAQLPGAPTQALGRFFARQQQVADALWPLFDDPRRLPPLTGDGLVHHAKNLARYLPSLGLLRRSLTSVMARDGVASWEPMRVFAAAMCQITIQAPPDEAEAVFALGAMDYPHRGAAHVQGGVGRLGHAMCRAIEDHGGKVRFADRVRGLVHRDGLWEVTTRRGVVRARGVVANLLPAALQSLLPEDHALVRPRLDRAVKGGWGAAMAYLVVEDHDGLPEDATHMQAVGDAIQPLIEGNHLLCSISPRGEGGVRTATVSTHMTMGDWRHDPTLAADRVHEVQARMESTLRARVPEVAEHVTQRFPGSPRTFARFTGRPEGFVGGIPRRVGLHHLLDLWPTQAGPRLWMVGDTTFPGQSVLSAALGGARTARSVAAAL